MATLRPRGKMTKPLVTPYNVGDRVVVVDNSFLDDYDDGTFTVCDRHWLRLGAFGTIRKIRISDPDDGDETFPLFRVEFSMVAQWEFVGSEIAPAAEAGDYLWLHRQLDGLKA